MKLMTCIVLLLASAAIAQTRPTSRPVQRTPTEWMAYVAGDQDVAPVDSAAVLNGGDAGVILIEDGVTLVRWRGTETKKVILKVYASASFRNRSTRDQSAIIAPLWSFREKYSTLKVHAIRVHLAPPARTIMIGCWIEGYPYKRIR